MFNRHNICYIVMPKHVAGPFPRVTTLTAAPVVSTTATVIAPFWPEIDLAIGVARGDISDRCTAKLSDLEEQASGLSASKADLLRLSPSGEVSRQHIKLKDRTYLEFTGTLSDGSSGISQGTSGAFAFVKGRPIGMAIKSDDPTRARFIRSGEILVHLRRFLEEQGGAYQTVSDAGVKKSPSNTGVKDALPLRFVRSSVPPINPMLAPENVVKEGQFVFSPARKMSIVFGFDRVVQLSRFTAIANATNTQTAPKSVLLRTSVDPHGERFLRWIRLEMGPDGVLDTGKLQPRNARYIELLVLDTWGSGDIVLDFVAAH